MKLWLVQRGLLVTLPVTAVLALGLDACSSDASGPAETTGKIEAVEPNQAHSTEQELTPSSAARERLAQIAQFKRFIMLPKTPSAAATGTSSKPLSALGQATSKQAPAARGLEAHVVPVVAKGVAERFVQRGERVRAEVSDRLKHEVRGPITVDLPKVAGGFVRFQPDDSKFGVEFAAQGAKQEVALETADGLANYPAAAPGGGDMVLRVSPDEVEDYVVFNQKPARSYVDYTIKVGEAAGLRLIENSLEFLSKDGNPEARVRPPEVIDADGTSHKAKLSVLDCPVDTSDQAPWGRPVTPPGHEQCTLRVSWNDSKLVYPIIVDPVWTSAKDLTFARYRNAATKWNQNGFLITCGGVDNNGDPLATCEQYNHGTDTWTTIASMKSPRSQFSLLPVGNDVLAVGDSSNYTSELLSAGTWTATGSNFSAGAGYLSLSNLMPAVTSDNAWVVLIDYNGKPYRYQASAKAWTVGTANGVYRGSYEVILQPNTGQVMRCGGTDNGSPAAALKTCEKYNPATDTWVMPGAAGAVANMNAARSYSGWANIDSTSVMLYGGYNPVASSYISTAEIYNSTTNTWTNAGTLPNNVQEYYLHNTSALNSGAGRILTTYGNFQSFDIATKAWSPITYYDDNNTYFWQSYGEGAVAPAGSKVMLVPVWTNGSGSGAQKATRLFDVGAKGAKCSATGECAAGLTCAKDGPYDQGYCCDSACTDPCQACFSGNKQSGTATGTCGPRSTNSYIGSYFPMTCVADGTTCGVVGGYCDGAGGCLKASTAVQCGNGSCLDGDTQNNPRMCDGKGSCAAQTTTDCNAGYACLSNSRSCTTYCNDDSYCTSSYYCQWWQNPYSTCQPKKSNGATCTYASECTSGSCADGVCCDTACDGTCEACTLALTGKATGSCKPITAGTDPQGDCADNGASTCGQNGLCNGAGACQLYASGSVCQAASCASPTSRNVPDTCTGTGTCTDNGTQNCSAGYACVSGVCQTSCTDDTQCASAYYCDTVAKQCVADKTQGQACPRDAACAGNTNCVDGVCCDTACTGTCRSCLKNRTGLPADGTCGDILDDTDPENECAKDVAYPTSCKAPGTCDGMGSCRVYAKQGIVATSDTCSVGTLTKTACDGAGNQKAQQIPCYPYKCNGAGTACNVACTTKSDCDDSSFCANGSCVGQKLNGAECRTNDECESRHCANIGKEPLPDDGAGGAPPDTSSAPGVCCDTACGNPCEACKKSIKGEGSDGTCGPVKDHTDPAGDCPVDPNNACGYNGQCDGDRHCRKVPAGTSCGATKCVGNSVQGQRCDGQGACVNNDGTTACDPYVCRDVEGVQQCTNPCVDDNDCADGYYCTEMACKKKLAAGKQCVTSAICASGFCVDGVCCDVSCNGQCEACDAPGNEGVCTPVQGDPHGNRVKCDHAGEECGGQCDGVNSASCKYAPNGTTCGTPSCDNDLASSSSCNGQGECKPNKNQECSPYVCGPEDTCLERCEQDADCGQGYACDETTQRCLPSAVAAMCSEDRLTSLGSNGTSTPCKPFLCVPASGTCAVSCAFTTDCSPDFVCEPSTKTCLPAPASDGGPDDTSCACRAAGAAPKRSNYLALLTLGVALTVLRRRRSTRPLPSLARGRASAPVLPLSE